MAQIEIRLPKMGESVTEATITNWLKNVGDAIEMDEPLVEVATDKVDNELPSEAEGILVKQLFATDEVAQVGDVIAIISTDGEAPETIENTPAEKEEVEVPSAEAAAATINTEIETVAATVSEDINLDKNGPSGKFGKYSSRFRSPTNNCRRRIPIGNQRTNSGYWTR